jgi:NADH dehydrogenase
MTYRRITVFGGSGFIGRYVTKRLAERGSVILAASRHASDALFLNTMGDVGQIALLNADFADEAQLKSALEGADSVVISVGILFERGKQRFDLVHHRGPALVARLARDTQVKQLVFVSAIGADPASPSAYARSKAAGEAAVSAAFPGATILRPSLVFGPEDDLFNRFAAMTRLSPMLPLIGGGKTRFQPVYVGDVADAIVGAFDRQEAQGRIFELGGPRTYTFRELMELMLVEIGRKRLLVSVPASLLAGPAALMEWLPTPPLTRDQILLLLRDNVMAPDRLGLAQLGITPTALELVLPTYLDRFRRGSRALGPALSPRITH